MKAIVRMNKWANAHTSIGLDALRIGLGIFLFWKGMQFASETEALVQLMQPRDPLAVTIVLAHYIAMAHLAGGIMVAFGLLTRYALLAQIPILIGAVVVHLSAPGGLDTISFMQALTALVAAGFFAVVGPGKHSVDYNLKMNM